MTTVNFKTTFFVVFSISYVRDEHMKRGIKTINWYTWTVLLLIRAIRYKAERERERESVCEFV